MKIGVLTDDKKHVAEHFHRQPVFAVSIAILDGGEPLIGVIYDELLALMRGSDDLG
jgi:hypothetical protein